MSEDSTSRSAEDGQWVKIICDRLAGFSLKAHIEETQAIERLMVEFQRRKKALTDAQLVCLNASCHLVTLADVCDKHANREWSAELRSVSCMLRVMAEDLEPLLRLPGD